MLSRLLYVLVCVAIVAGVWLGGRDLPWDFEPTDPAPLWSARYEAIAPQVADWKRMYFVPEDPGEGYRLFRAQFVLAPLVLDRTTLDDVPVDRLATRPLLLDYQSPKALRLALRRLERRAAAAGVGLDTETVGKMTLVRGRRRGR
jgi:hypothetical protein